MKYKILLALLLFISIHSFSKDKNGKTFLILFDKTELKEAQSSPEYIELSFLDKFHTRTYSGNSDAALLVTFPDSRITECEIGEMRVQINPSTWLQLHEIAYRIIDLEENKDHYRTIVEEKKPEVALSKMRIPATCNLALTSKVEQGPVSQESGGY